MSKEYDKVAFMAHLLLGENLSRDINIQLNQDKNENLLNDTRHMKEIVVRMRRQVGVILEGVRALQTRHGTLSHDLKLEYSTYENIMARLELKRHWALYRKSVQDYHQMFQMLNKAVDSVPCRQAQQQYAA